MFDKDKLILQQLGLIPTDEKKTIPGHWGTAPFTYHHGHVTVQAGELRGPLSHVPGIRIADVQVITFQGDVRLPADSSHLLAGSSHLKTVRGIQNWDTSSVEDFTYLFADDVQLHQVDLAALDTHHVVDMSGMFYHTGLSVIDVSDWDFHRVQAMRQMFACNPDLQHIDIHAANTGHVRDFQQFIYQNPRLQGIDVRGMDTHNARNMNRMFAHNEIIPTLDIQGFSARHVDDMRCMFSTCPHLQSIPHLMDLSNEHYNKMTFMFTCDNELDTVLTMDTAQFYHHSEDSYEGIF